MSPWLADPPIPRMFGDYFGIRRDYGVEEWMADIVPQGAVKSVHVTAMWGPGKALDETRWLQAQPTSTAFRTASSAMSISPIPMSRAALKAQKQFPNVRGVRHMLYWDSQPVRQGASRPDFCNDPDFPPRLRAAGKIRTCISNCRSIAGQAQYAVELIKAFPNVPMILVHAGMLTDRDAGGDRGMARGAHRDGGVSEPACEAVGPRHVFSSGITLPQARQVIRDVIQIFGVERTIYGSNFPLEKAAHQLRGILRHLSQGDGGIPRSRPARGAARQRGGFYRL